MLRRAIRNLVDNALAHTPEGTDVDIVVGETGTVNVLDRGEGVPPAMRELIFKRFWRRDRRRAGSAGLGLSIVKHIVDMHEGAISVENRPTGGAEFFMRLPLAK
jgi:signal transduction histidine kinase